MPNELWSILTYFCTINVGAQFHLGDNEASGNFSVISKLPKLIFSTAVCSWQCCLTNHFLKPYTLHMTHVCTYVDVLRKNTLFAVELLVHWASLVVVVME